MSLINSDHTRRWPGGCLIWRFAAGLSQDEKDRLTQSMADWTGKANVRFLERTTQRSFVTFRSDDNVDNVSHSSNGMIGGEQSLFLEPITVADGRAHTSRHEIGHALGLHHEHMRCNRDDFVTVSDKIKLERWGDFFPKMCGSDVDTVGDYDFTSVMHYNPGTRATSDGSVDLTGTNAANQTALDDKKSRSNISAGDAASVNTLHGGNSHVYQLSSDGQIEKTVRQYNWSSGWTIATPFLMDVRNFLFLLKRAGGTMHVNAINADGSIGSRVESSDWSSDWTAAVKYAVGPVNYLFLYKAGDGTVHIHNLNVDGTIGSRVSTVQIESGWTTVRHYTIGVNNFLILANATDGTWRIRRINWDGKIGESIQAASWSTGWTSVEPYVAGGRHYLFRLKSSSGTADTKRIRDDGTLPTDEVETHDWTSGWTTAIPYEVSGSTFLFLLKSVEGTMHINRLKDDGTVGAITDRREFGPGWTVGAVYHVGVNTYAILIKT